MLLLCLLYLMNGVTFTCQQGLLEEELDVCYGDNCGLAGAEKLQNSPSQQINVIITFTNAVSNANLQAKFKQTVDSMLSHAIVPIALYIVGEDQSQRLAKQIVLDIQNTKHITANVQVEQLDVDKLALQLREIIEPLQEHFSYKPGAYYSHALFFLSVAIHRVFPISVKRVIMLDADLKFMDDIKKLHDQFDLFSVDNVLGIAHELQPVYRHQFWDYRNHHPGTRVGEPPPKGLPGFNSGVLLLNLDKMRGSELYNSLITADSIRKLTTEFKFKGHLGDQDFFTLVAMKYEELFYSIPCNWNRQLCTWWRDMGGYKGESFDVYHRCEGLVKIYHGNCNTPIP